MLKFHAAPLGFRTYLNVYYYKINTLQTLPMQLLLQEPASDIFAELKTPFQQTPALYLW